MNGDSVFGQILTSLIIILISCNFEKSEACLHRKKIIGGVLSINSVNEPSLSSWDYQSSNDNKYLTRKIPYTRIVLPSIEPCSCQKSQSQIKLINRPSIEPISDKKLQTVSVKLVPQVQSDKTCTCNSHSNEKYLLVKPKLTTDESCTCQKCHSKSYKSKKSSKSKSCTCQKIDSSESIKVLPRLIPEVPKTCDCYSKIKPLIVKPRLPATDTCTCQKSNLSNEPISLSYNLLRPTTKKPIFIKTQKSSFKPQIISFLNSNLLNCIKNCLLQNNNYHGNSCYDNCNVNVSTFFFVNVKNSINKL